MSGLNVLVAGESWIKHTIHMKGFDQFHNTEYEEGATFFLEQMAEAGHNVTYVRGHEISTKFPKTVQEIDAYDVVVISDIGSNSFQLPDETFLRSEKSPNRLGVIADFVGRGGGLVMIGGYLSFTGIDGKARYGMTPLADVLPVNMLTYDDRIEVPEGLKVDVALSDHPVLGGTPAQWPPLLGYNRLVPKADSTVVVRSGDDPMLVVGDYGQGRAVAFASDLAPHWAPPEFVEWPHYTSLWSAILSWAGGCRTAGAGEEV
ncbi:cytoplasmic protein [Gordonia sp. zg691]|uniref:Cytoplasmic protein n=1 Tax=Gordonia jinghuaiqii TaxID=2758710 RepID=A0A7D7QP24_9ACTN|nr:glutamine amidotransferase [Gordonia jinghuaiqii]MBD0863649.1 cytoplasmic protein [Gordonia jinghuaiqii]MCR5979383.1 cytoplasmic protein [Gordonia jinghuaiqii]QMT01166.1 cytoplasmic protein [Gordonia jinghuaiqii]